MAKFSEVIFLTCILFILIKNGFLSPTRKPEVREANFPKTPEVTEFKKIPVIMIEVPLKKDINNPLIKNLLEKGSEKYQKYYKKSYEPVITKIRSIKHLIRTQSEFIFHVTFGASNCTKGIKENCVLVPNGENVECIIDAYSFFLNSADYKVFIYCTPDILKEFPKSPKDLKVQPYVFSPFFAKWSLR